MTSVIDGKKSFPGQEKNFNADVFSWIVDDDLTNAQKSSSQVSTAGVLDMERLDITNEEFSFEGIDDDIKNIQTNPQIVQALNVGANLREYSRKVENDLTDLERGTIADYIKEGESIAGLYRQISICDSVLAKLDEVLTNFQSNIRSVGGEIKQLQDKCLNHQIRLNNRKMVEERLTKFLDEVQITEELEDFMSQGEVNAEYIQSLMELNKKISYLENYKSMDSSQKQAPKAIRELEPKIEALVAKTISKIRSFLLNTLHSLKNQQSLRMEHKELLNFGYLFQFIFKHAPEVAQEVKGVYIDISSKLYFSFFRQYISAVSRVQLDIANKNDLLGIPESQSGNLFLQTMTLSSKKQIKNKEVFSLSARQMVVDDLDKPTVANLLETSPNTTAERYPYEFLFKSMIFLLMDDVAEELKFTSDFFLYDMDQDILEGAFQRVIQCIMDNLEHYSCQSFDCVGMLIMLVVLQKVRVLSSKRLVSCLDSYLVKMYNVLVARFFFVLDLNIASIKNANAKDLTNNDFRPHYITRRYTEFCVSMLHLSTISEDMGDITFVKKLNQYLSKMREEIEKLLIRFADAKHKDWKSKSVFLMNNFDLIISTTKERNLHSVDIQQFEKLIEMKMNDYVQDELGKSFGKLFAFVKDYGSLVKDTVLTEIISNNQVNSNSTPSLSAQATSNVISNESIPVREERINVREEEVEWLLKEFHNNWKVELDKISASIGNHFLNFKFGMRIFQKLMEDLLDTYTTFVKIIRKYFKNLRMSKFFTPETEVTFEMKKLFVHYE